MMSKKMSFTRIQKLAEMYGPFVRFFPEGSEEAVDDAIKDAEDADLKDNKEFNKVRQQVDQEKANALKAREETQAATEQLAEAKSSVDDLKAQLADATAKIGVDEDVELKESDYPIDTDLALVKSIKAINKKLEAKDAQIATLTKDASAVKAEKQTTQDKADQEAAYQDMLNDLDEDYGPQFRNAAVTEFEAKFQAGEVKGGPAKATRILEKCYKDAVKAEATKEADSKKKGVQLDSGSGGGSGENLSGITLTKGSLEDVTKQAAAVLNSS